ncbi:adenylosuccinate synthetase [Streptococcus gordonii]|uniref:phage tail family protein n=1 Tax=Streptococcus gordonii TaxID=1302 RepID=UPI0006B25548|nr:phage tail family protein [Streptococcus gordonii]ALD72716.1 adenylosuccinate synthetase [Streptococcus gordonii]QBX25168.1 hypothetical protein Javan242_0012 [Streptococcus phage Javan242]
MAVNYLIINTFNTNTITDSVVTDFGDIKGAIPRYDEQKKLYGTNGQYNIEDGAYDGYERTLKIFVKRYEDAQAIINAFNKLDNVLEFSYQPDSIHYADLLDSEISLHGQNNWIVSIRVYQHPFRYTKNVQDVVLGSSGTVTNPGTVYSEPIITIEGQGEVTLTIGNQTMVLNLSGGAKIDCRQRKQNVYTLNGQLQNTIRVRGPFFELKPGISGITTAGNVSKIKIQGNWRYRI